MDIETIQLEKSTARKFNSEVFFKQLKKHNINYETFFADLNMIKREDKEKFNLMIRDCKDNLKLSISECVFIIDELITDLNKVLSILNDKNYKELRQELVEKYKIKKNINTLSALFKKV